MSFKALGGPHFKKKRNPCSHKTPRRKRTATTHQADEDENELYDVRVGHRVEPPHQGVGDGHSSRDPDAHIVGQIQDHTHSNTCFIHTNTHTSVLPCKVLMEDEKTTTLIPLTLICHLNLLKQSKISLSNQRVFSRNLKYI